MCGGGGGGGGLDVATLMQMQNQQDVENRRIASEQETAASQAKQAAEAKFQTDLGTARTGAQDVAKRYFSDRGIPFDQALVNSIINQVNVPDLDKNPASYFTPDIFSTGIAKEEQAQRSKYSNQVDQMFRPGFERALLPDTAMDPIVASILGEQTKNAKTILDYNKARGLLNPTGYDTAQTALNQQEATGRSTLMDLANSVLGKERGALTDIRGEAGTAASGYNFGAPAPSFQPYYERATKLASTDLSGLEGSIRGALGSTNLFDVPTAIARGGTAQGPINLTTRGVDVTGGLPGVDRTKPQQRGLGTTGVF